MRSTRLPGVLVDPRSTGRYQSPPRTSTPLPRGAKARAEPKQRSEVGSLMLSLITWGQAFLRI